MPAIRSFSISGIKCWFWSNDHEPPHFHAKRTGEWELRVNFLNEGAGLFEVKWQRKKVSGTVLREIESKVQQHREALLLEWEAAREEG